MKEAKKIYHGYRFPPTIISHAVWLYHRFCLSLRDVEDLLAERGIAVSYESIRQWCNRFGPAYARKLKKRQGRLGDTWYLDEVFIKIRGELHYLWRAVDQDGDTIDILVQKRRNKAAAKRFFRLDIVNLTIPPGPYDSRGKKVNEVRTYDVFGSHSLIGAIDPGELCP
jgi:putative transposase